MAASDPIVVIGSGLAGYTFARELRKLDKNRPLTIVSADDAHFYSKPMISNALAGKKLPAQLAMKSAAQMAQELNATVLPRSRVQSIDTAGHRIVGSNGDLAYSQLVLALGADPIRLPLAGDGAADVLSVNDLDDFARLHTAIQGRKRVTVMGAGLIGCEFANDLLISGFEVDIIDIAPLPLGRLLPEQPAAAMRDALAAIGARWHLGRSVKSVDRAGGATPGYTVTLDDGKQFHADAVLSAIGLRPRIDLARAAGLAVNRGVVVDAILRTSDPDVYALGDCAEVSGVVLPFVLPIMQCARALAWSLHTKDHAVTYPPMPVVVKTPALPTVVCPPAPGVAGRWHVRNLADGGMVARFHDADGKLAGFALTGSATKEKQALAKEMQGEPAKAG